MLLDERGEERGRLVDPTGSLAVAVADVESRTPFVFGVSSEGITRVALTSRDRPDTPAQRTWLLPDGRVAFVADFAPSYNRFQQVVGYDAACDVVVALDLRTLEEAPPDRPRCDEAGPDERRDMRSAGIAILAVALVVALGAPASARGADVVHQSWALDETSVDFNICSWTSTFTASGHYHFTNIVTQARTEHLTFHEAVNWTLVVSDDPNVPVEFRGATWRGRNELTLVLNLDLDGNRIMFVSVNPFSEGPFHGLLERIAFVVSPNGTVRVDSYGFVGTIDCDALTT